MNPYLFILAKKLAKKKLEQQGFIEESRPPITREARNIAVNVGHFVKNWIFIALGVLSACYGLKAFLLPIEFIDGGATGISLLISITSNWPLSLMIFLVNLPFFAFGFSQLNKEFIFKSVISVSLLAVAVHFIDFPTLTDDKLLVAFFGGFFIGLGIGLAIRGGAIIDGTEIIAIYTSKKTGFLVGDVITVINIVIFLVAVYLLSIEQALYSIITYLVASRIADFVIDGFEEYTAAIIISEKSEEIRLMIINKLGRGATLLNGKRGFTRTGEVPQPIDVIYSVITRLEIAKLKAEVEKIDPDAFITLMTIKDTRGGMVKKRTI